MFGYLTMQKRFMTWQMNRGYRNYYCGTCFGLEYNYGQVSRLLLSYDVALLGILVKCHENPLRDYFYCIGACKEKKCVFSGGGWNQIAAINLLLVNEKLKDDINDDQSWKARIGKFLLGGKIHKAQKQYPQMAEAIAQGYKDIYALEKQNSGVREIEECFADMMEHTMSSYRKLEKWEIDYIRCISRWIYYIDALDDYEKDYREKKFNPLKKADAPTFYEYIRRYMNTICDDLQYIYEPIAEVLEIMPKDTMESRLLIALIRDNIPYTTSRILSGRRIVKVRIGSIWDEPEKTA